MNIKKKAAFIIILVLIMSMLCAFMHNVDNKDQVAIFNNIEIPEGTTVNGDIVAIFGDITIDGSLTGDMVSIFGDMSVSGTVGGNVVAIFGKVSLKDSGVIKGDFAGIFGEIDKSPKATIKGEIADVTIPFGMKKHTGLIPKISYGSVIGLFVVYGFSCLALLIAPGRINLMAEESKIMLGRRFGIGFLVMMLFIPVSIILSVLFAITIIGILFIPFIFIAFILVTFAGTVALQVAIGRRITGPLEGNRSLYIHLMVGVVLMYVLKMIPILGWLAYLILVIYSLGIAVDTRIGSDMAGRRAKNV